MRYTVQILYRTGTTVETTSLAMDARVVGISAYLDATPRVALHGRIKNQPEDFVVEEIALDGTVLVLDESDRDARRLPTHDERERVVEKMKEMRLASGKRRMNDPLVFPVPPGGWREELTRLLHNKDSLAQIEQVAMDSNSAPNDSSVSLEAPIDFRDRVYLQICIQQCFPSLDCRLHSRTTPAIDEEHSIGKSCLRIEVTQDGLFKKFRNAGISHENANSLLAFIRNGSSHVDAARGIELAHDDSKEARTLLHRQISSASSILRTRTETRRGKQCLVVAFAPQNNKKRKRMEQAPQPYVRFVLQKTNLEHFSCFERLARHLKLPQSMFATAGTKDKFAVTYQYVTVQGIAPESILQLNHGFTEERGAINGIRTGRVEYVPAPLNLGELTGNKFTIVIRGLPEDLCDEDFDNRVQFVKARGFINYFGFQRVGLPTSDVRPHQIGKLMVAGKWEEAVRKILSPSAQDPPECASAKASYVANSENVDDTLKLVPQNAMQVERSVLTGLKRFGTTNWEAAIRNIPFGRRTMYLHAYQSYLFNVLASYRIEVYGTHVVEGDLVREDDSENVIVATKRIVEHLSKSFSNPLSRVVLPLPGGNVLRPTNKVGEHLSQILEKHDTTSLMAESSILKGAYRSLLETPRDVEWSHVEDNRRAIRIKFVLSSGSFATMCLREILHMSL